MAQPPSPSAAAVRLLAARDEGLGMAAVVPEAALAERARSDAAAFDVLYRRHHAAIGAHLHRRTGAVTETEDLLSETFLRALKGLPRFRARGVELRHWLHRIATSVAHRGSATRRRRQEEPLHAHAELQAFM